MSKQVKFSDTEDDKKLVRQIIEYQQESGITSFVAAVRKLCSDALNMKKLMR